MSLRTFNTHGLLKLPVELLQEICRELQDWDDDDDDYSDMHGDFDEDNPEHIKDLARLALTSRTLYLAANPILWGSLPGLEPLLDLMPPESWDESAIKARYDTPKDPASKTRPLPDFWAPVRKLADLVKRICIFPIPSRLQTMIMLARPSQKLLPRVTTVYLIQDKERRLEFKNGCADHYLKFLKFIIPFSGITDLNIDHTHSLALSQARFPQLKLLVEYYYKSNLGPEAVIDASQYRDAQLNLARSIITYQHLRHLDMAFSFGPNEEFLEGLARLQQLAFLRVGFDQVDESDQTSWIERQPKYPTDAFPALELLELDGVAFADATAILQSCPKRPNLRSIVIESVELEPSTALLALTESIKRVCDPAVLAEVYLCRDVPLMEEFYDASFDWPLTFEHVEPLTALSGLETIGFGGFCGMTITEEQWAQLDRSWPNLLVSEVHGNYADF
ncbi:hypothetical protein EV714DRAFT_285425 [Schizophyllum commune]